MSFRVLAIAGLAFALLAGGAAGAEPSAARGPEAIAADPAIRSGTLPNGLRYVLQSHAQPTGAMSIRLRFDVGSLEESEDELGVAHFVEHLAFSGGRSIAAGQMEPLFAAAGVVFGRDQNAFTGPYTTLYQIDLASADTRALDVSFRWLRDVADGLDLTPAAVEHERPIIQHERLSYMDVQHRHQQEFRVFLAPELRVTAREAIGTPESLAAMDAAKARRFYERWYRPDEAILVIVGDAPLDSLEQKVRDTFGSWSAKGPPPPRAVSAPPDLSRPLAVRSWETASGLPSQATLCLKRPVEAPGEDTLARARRREARELWQSILNERLARIGRQPSAPFHSVLAYFEDDHHEMAQTCLDISPEGQNWREALTTAYGEVRRFYAHGPTPQELQRGIDMRLAAVRAGRDHAEGYSNPSLAAFILDEIDRGDRLASLEERYRAELAGKDLTPDEVRDSMRADWRGGGPVLAVIARPRPDEAEMRQTWAKLNFGPAPDQIAVKALRPWAYSSFGAPGRVVSRKLEHDPEFVRLTLSNGVIVNFKTLPQAKGDVTVMVSIGAGRPELAGLHPFAAELAAQALVEGGLSRNSFEEVSAAMSRHVWSLNMSVKPHRFEITGKTNGADLEAQLQVFAAYLSEPAFERTMEADIVNGLGELYRTFNNVPFWAASNALYSALATTGDLSMPPGTIVGQTNAAAVSRIFAPVLTRDPFEVTIVGDVSEADATAALVRTLGALPPRRPQPLPPGGHPFARFQPVPADVMRSTFGGPPEQAAVEVAWPLFVSSPAHRRDERTMIILTSMLQDALRHRLREEMGETYSPNAVLNLDDNSDQGVVAVIVECSPAHAEQVLAAVRAVVADFAAGRIQPAQLEAVRAQILAEGPSQLQSMDWWLAILNGSVGDPDQVVTARSWSHDYGTISLDEIKAAARAWLSGPGAAVMVMPRAALNAAPLDPIKGNGKKPDGDKKN